MATRTEINERLKKVNIKGKPYVEVAQRVQGFWEIFPNGRIATDWLRLEDEQCVCQASIWDGDKLLAQGTAWEQRKGNINTTSYVENCETSAIGRALGNAGIGSVQSIASADEMAHAMGQQAVAAAPAKKPEPKLSAREEWRPLYKKIVQEKILPAEEAHNVVTDIIGSDNQAVDWTDEQCIIVRDTLRVIIENYEEERKNNND